MAAKIKRYRRVHLRALELERKLVALRLRKAKQRNKKRAAKQRQLVGIG